MIRVEYRWDGQIKFLAKAGFIDIIKKTPPHIPLGYY